MRPILAKVITLTGAFIVATALAAGSRSPYREFDVSADISTPPDTGGRADINISATSHELERDFRVRIEKTIGLHYAGVRDTTISSRWRDTCQFRIAVDVPDDALSGIVLSVETGNRTLFFIRSFDLTGDAASVEKPPLQRLMSRAEMAQLLRRPRRIVVQARPELVFHPTLPSVSHSDGAPELPQGYNEAPVIKDIQDTTALVAFDWVNVDPLDDGYLLLHRDRAVVARMPEELYLEHYAPEALARTERGQMSQLERSPLDYAEEEWILIDDTIFGRAYGQKRFEPKAFVSDGVGSKE